MIKLIITLPDGSQSPSPAELLDHRVTVGSGVDNTIVVPHESVAETHLELIHDGSGYLVADLAGGGATSINGHPIETGVHYQLETGTSIQIGGVEAVYIASEEVQEEPASAPSIFSGAQAFSGTASTPSFGGEPSTSTHPLPSHPPGVFVPRKAQRSLWVMASVTVTFVAVAAAAIAAVLSSIR